MKRAVKRVSRLQRIEEELLASGPDGLTAAELARRLGVNRSTITRDIADMDDVPIATDHYRYVIDRQHYLSSIRLSGGESLMLYVAMRQLIRRFTHVPDLMLSAMKKLALALRHPMADHLIQSTEMLYERPTNGPDRSKVWETLIEGWLQQIAVRITYQKFQNEESRTYEVEPYLFEPAILSEGVYVIGHSLTHDDLRTFKVERITRAMLTTQRFSRPVDLTADDILRHAWGVWYGEELHTVKLRFSKPVVARRVKETLWHPSQQIYDLPDGGIVWSVQVASQIELLPWIRGWGPDVEVLEPPELRVRVADEMRRAAAIYEEV